VSTVKFPAVLRATVGGAREVEARGATIGELIDGLVVAYPALRDQLLAPDGDLNRFVNVYVNGSDVRYLDGLATAVGDVDEVRLLPAMAGGAR
jgi:sulfur-carrier protein